jgi:hypothetical protein
MEISYRYLGLAFIGLIVVGYFIYTYGISHLVDKTFKVLNFLYTVFIFAYLFIMLSALIDFNTLSTRSSFNFEDFLYEMGSNVENQYVNPTNTGNKDWRYVQSIIKSDSTVEKFFENNNPLIDSITQEEIKDVYVYTIDECHNDYLSEETLKNLYGPGKRFHNNMRNPFTNQSLKEITKIQILN